MPKKYSEEELDLLTEEERLAAQEAEDDEDIEEEEEEQDAEEEGVKAAEASTGEEEGEEATAEPEGAGSEVGEDEGTDAEEAAAAQTGEESEAAGETQSAAETDEPDPFDSYEARPTPIWVAPEGATERLAEIKTRKKEIAKKFNDGEIELDEFNTSTDALDEEKDTLRQQLDRAEMSRQMAQTEWLGGTVKAFLGMHPEYKAEEAFHALDAEVRRLQGSGTFDNPFDPKILAAAHKNVMGLAKALGGGAAKISAGEPQPKATAPVKADDPKTKIAAKPGKREIPPTLAKAPASDDSLDDGGEFAVLDRLADKDPIAFENAMAKMSEADRDRYLAAS